ncbi:hypothetical protein PENTCL1PPCAC_20056 [Pristionchus entomophagus]|uniref:C2H2-type domain-containing protein n=1 Tax=Pristionchus entomophagus TaxID=358040 RepID=A0AAV5TUD8_9BILA|nr:hypothetical protein PENTCL1PPCAC_20056 [Pristionchus entomophagus]
MNLLESPKNETGESRVTKESQKNGEEEEMEDQEERKKKTSSYEGHNQSKAIRKRPLVRMNNTELGCPECVYVSLSCHAWMDHLRHIHSTTPRLAGLALLCKCGDESITSAHSEVCSISEITVIKKRDGPIRRFYDKKTTPQCVLCEMYPSCHSGYAQHLRKHHKSNLHDSGIYLICSCGFEVRNEPSAVAHLKKEKCDVRDFTLHKLDEK